jgi:hypothetical protein
MESAKMSKVHAHLLACAANFAERSRKPRVAWDCMGASTWAKLCETFATEVAAMTDEQGIAHLQAKRATMLNRDFKGGDGLPGWYLQMDTLSRLDEIIDPIAKERRGWIEIDSMTDIDGTIRVGRPYYRRMLGINQQVASLLREKGETDDHWLTRRAEWLGTYHPQVWVIRNGAWVHEEGDFRGREYTQIVGTVAAFIEMHHLTENDQDRGFRPADPNFDLTYYLTLCRQEEDAERAFDAAIKARRADMTASA